jgi:hypothetical protein
MTAFFLPRAMSAKGFESIGRLMLSAMAMRGSCTGSGSEGASTPTNPGVASTCKGMPREPYFNVMFICFLLAVDF